MRFFYTILFYLALPFIFLRLLWRSRRVPDNRKRWAKRLGFCPLHLKECIWLHAVSVGESITNIPLVQQLKILVNQLIPFQDYHPEIRAIVERLQATQIELKDISGEVAHIGNAINYDAERISHLNERLSIGYRLQKKTCCKIDS